MEKSTNSSFGKVAKIGDRKDRRENRLQTEIVALGGKLIHLQKTLIRAALHFDKVGNLNFGGNFGEIETATDRALLVRHASLLALLPLRPTPGGNPESWLGGALVTPQKARP